VSFASVTLPSGLFCLPLYRSRCSGRLRRSSLLRSPNTKLSHLRSVVAAVILFLVLQYSRVQLPVQPHRFLWRGCHRRSVEGSRSCHVSMRGGELDSKGSDVCVSSLGVGNDICSPALYSTRTLPSFAHAGVVYLEGDRFCAPAVCARGRTDHPCASRERDAIRFRFLRPFTRTSQKVYQQGIHSLDLTVASCECLAWTGGPQERLLICRFRINNRNTGGIRILFAKSHRFIHFFVREPLPSAQPPLL
jgi:hypothetical protein